jgi:hypothetical protein
MERLIRDAGFTPARRKQDYTLLDPSMSVRSPSQALGARMGSLSGAETSIGADAA